MGRKKKEIKMKEPVRIREKRLNDGNVSLYLDMYYMGARKKEGLKLYLVPEVNAAAKLQNKNTLKLAEQIKAERIIDIQRHGLVNWENVKKGRMTLAAWVEKYTKDENGLTPASMRSKRNAQARVEQYLLYIGKPNLALKEVDKDFCKGFIAFLKTCTFNNGKKTLGSTTCRIFVNRLAAALNMAVREGLIDSNPFKLLDAKEKPQKKSAMREFLTIEELRTLIATPCRYDIVKKTFLFSCMTGLRLGDMQHLRWSDIKDVNGVQMVSIIQHKTKRPVTVPLNTLALSLLPSRPENGEDGIIFPLVKKSDNVAKYVRRIKNKAGIEKDFTYHSSRHSAATLAITAGAELYSVCKILGHGSIASTQVYAKVNMEKKVEAMSLTDGMF